MCDVESGKSLLGDMRKSINAKKRPWGGTQFSTWSFDPRVGNPFFLDVFFAASF